MFTFWRDWIRELASETRTWTFKLLGSALTRKLRLCFCNALTKSTVSNKFVFAIPAPSVFVFSDLLDFRNFDPSSLFWADWPNFATIGLLGVIRIEFSWKVDGSCNPVVSRMLFTSKVSPVTFFFTWNSVCLFDFLSPKLSFVIWIPSTKMSLFGLFGSLDSLRIIFKFGNTSSSVSVSLRAI